MSNLENYKEKLSAIQAIPDNEVKVPNIPVDVFLQEAENLCHWSLEDKEELTAKGLNWDMVKDIQVRCGALREAQSRWITRRFSQDEAERLWKEKSPAAYDLRDELLHSYRFAFRKLPDLLSTVSEITKHTGHADMIQDLNDLSVLGRKNNGPLKAINFNMTLLDEAAGLVVELPGILSAVINERAGSEIKKIRDQAYTYLKEAVNEVREFGQYVFRRNSARSRGYRSEYFRKNRHKSGAEEDPDTSHSEN